MNVFMTILKTTVALSGVIFILIAVHRFLYYYGIINLEFKRVDRIKRLFTISFITHMASLILFTLISVLT